MASSWRVQALFAGAAFVLSGCAGGASGVTPAAGISAPTAAQRARTGGSGGLT